MLKLKNKKSDVVCVGGATRDFMFYSSAGELVSTDDLAKQKLLAFEYGAKIMADKIYYTFGGGAANSAVSFANLGLKTAIVCKIGADEDGQRVATNLKNHGVNTNWVKFDKNNPTAFSMILTVKGQENEHIAFAYRGANELLSAKDLPKEISTRWFYVTSLPKIGWEGIMDNLIRRDANLAWNPGNSQLQKISALKKYLPKVKVLMLNKDEALEFKKLKDIKGLIKYIHHLGSPLVVITDGSVGAYVYDGHKYYFMKALKIKTADTVGVGDAFSSAFTSALIYGNNIKTALSWGIKNSASVITKIGAQNGLLTKRQISR